ncbi:hypothetical protein ACTXPS_19220 [Brachybacterium tyrofermentans]|uniref:hypothetical protein n=1 Tax=Brachybacterium tyrofermentans TaxID=47848 RepID=UPI003FCF2C3E
MENDPRDMTRRGDATSQQEALDTLAGLDIDRAQLAERVVTPWWYHPILGASVAMIVGAQALPGALSPAVLALGAAMIPVLVMVYTRSYGVVARAPTGPRTRRLMGVLVVLLIVGIASNLVIKLTGIEPAWGLVGAVICGVATVVLGRRYDDLLRIELASGDRVEPSGRGAA